MPDITVREIGFHRLQMRTRFPFEYGIARMTEAPHLFVVATVDVGDRTVRGLSADGLPPKWFTKNPNTSFEEDDLPSMLRVIRHAASTSAQIGRQPDFFTWWRELDRTQHQWAEATQTPQLLAGFGTSLIERAVLDAVCRATDVSLFHALRDNTLGISLGSVRSSLKSLKPHQVLPSSPMDRLMLRHTIGLSDSLGSDRDGDSGDPEDGLPYTLRENINRYGLQRFKIKLSGELDRDRRRLQAIAAILHQDVGVKARFTLDGNETFESISQFREAWSRFRESPALREFFDRSLLFVEQPVHRSLALHDSVGAELHSWIGAPPIIIDESDGDLTCLPRALRLGYSGTSHKNCKGIMKGLLGAATIFRERGETQKELILSAEDLACVGPISLLQDLAVVAALGISHVERNGHHYFAGLSMFPQSIQQSMLEQHGDLYERHAAGFASLAPRDGLLSMESINEAPFGVRPLLAVERFDRWEF